MNVRFKLVSVREPHGVAEPGVVCRNYHVSAACQLLGLERRGESRGAASGLVNQNRKSVLAGGDGLICYRVSPYVCTPRILALFGVLFDVEHIRGTLPPRS